MKKNSAKSHFSSCLSGTLAALFLASCGTGTLNSGNQASKLTTEELPKTEVKSQVRFGICWSYGTIALVESVALSKGQVVDLSEEQIVFYHMAETLLQMFQTLTTPDLIFAMARGNIPEGWNARIQPEDEIPMPAGVQRTHDALELLELYGAVPEDQWSFKVPDAEAKKLLVQAIQANVSALLKQGEQLSKLSLKDVMEKILVGKGAFPSVPPLTFTWQGKETSSVDFLKKQLQFQPTEFDSLVVRKSDEYEGFVMALKEALVMGMTIPLAFPINIDRLKGDLFTGSDISDDKNWYAFGGDGGHLVLVTDFLNVGGKRGATNSATALKESLAPASQLQEIVFKNSWGIGAKTNETGESIGFSADGFYRMDVSYLKGAMRVSELTQSRWNTVQAVLPKAVLAKTSPIGGK